MFAAVLENVRRHQCQRLNIRLEEKLLQIPWCETFIFIRLQLYRSIDMTRPVEFSDHGSVVWQLATNRRSVADMFGCTGRIRRNHDAQ
jgi:hypothetical protein